MSGWPYLLLLLLATLLAGEDFRTRRICVAWLAALGGATLTTGWITTGWRITLQHAAGNMLLLLLTAAAIGGYALLRRKPLCAFFRQGFGGGDAVMLCTLTPVFAPSEYILFLITACIAGLLGWCVTRRQSIPLAGFLSLTLIGWALYKLIGSWN